MNFTLETVDETIISLNMLQKSPEKKLRHILTLKCQLQLLTFFVGEGLLGGEVH